MYSENFIAELQKLYPKIKIPFYKEQEYYLNCFLEDEANFSFLPNAISDLSLLEEDLKNEGKSITKFKLEKFDEIVKDFNNCEWTKSLSELDLEKIFGKKEFKTKDFNNWNPNKVYISIDLNEANWSVFKHFVLKLTPGRLNWFRFVTTKYNLPPALANSKSFRQFVLGNTNPKRLNKLGEFSIQELAEKIKNNLPEINLVSQNADELIYELQNNEFLISNVEEIINNSGFYLPTKCNVFKISEVKNFGEVVKIKETIKFLFSNVEGITSGPKVVKRELINVPGNRFFIHYKTLILNKEIHDNDLLFELDRKLAKWVL